jgi:hypothetical protein
MDFDAQEARHTLARLEERLQREVEDIRKVLGADVPTHIVRAIRGTFERSAAADALDDAAITALKKATQDCSQRVSAEVLTALEDFAAWTWPTNKPLPTEASTLRDHPTVASVLDRIGDAVREVLAEHGVPVAAGDTRTTYTMPAYFVAGHFMKSLVGNYWRALGDFEALRIDVSEADQAGQRDKRRSRWESL